MSVTDILPFIGDVANALSQSRQNRLNREFAAEQSDLAWQRSQQQWEREIQYNSFSNQMKLLADAGLNPNLAYDQSTDSASGQTPQMAQYAGVAPQFNSPVQIAQTRLLEAQANNLNQDTLNRITEGQKAGIELQEILNNFNAHRDFKDGDGLNYWESQVKYQSSIQNRDMVQAGLDEKSAAILLDYISTYGITSSTLELDAMQKNIDLINSQIGNIQQDTKLKQAEISNLRKQQELYNAQITNYAKLNNLTDLQALQLSKDIQKTQITLNMLKQFNNDVNKLPEEYRSLGWYLINQDGIIKPSKLGIGAGFKNIIKHIK